MIFQRHLPRWIAICCSATILWLRLAVGADDNKSAATAPTEKNPMAGHSMNGEAFNEGPRQSAYLMPGMAKIHFPITSQSALARRFFEQGVCQLHGFWHFEAERSFRQAASLDPGCAMAYWGMSMANGENEKRARGFIAKAVSLKAKATAREAAWVEAFDRFFREKQDDKDRRRKLIRDLEAIVQNYPEEIEAKAFLAWLIWANSQKGLAITSHQAVDALIAEVLREQPLHPGAHHYRIHLWDNEKAERALGAAALIGQSASAIAHQWHMSGHIFSKLKRYDDAAWQQEASARADHAYMMRDRVMPYQIHNYAHNNQWLATDLAHQGRVREAVAVAQNLVELPRHPAKNKVSNSGSCARMGRDRLFEILPRYELWQEAIALAESNIIEPTDNRSEQIKRLKLLGIAHFALGRLTDGDKYTAALAALEKQPADKSKAEKKPTDKASAKTRSAERGQTRKSPVQVAAAAKTPVGKTKANESKPNNGKSPTPEPSSDLKELAAWRLHATKEFKSALAAFEKLSQRKTLLAQSALLAGDAKKAEDFARQAVQSGVNEVDALATLVAVLHGVGKKSAAKDEFAKLRDLGRHADLSLPCLKRLEGMAKEWHCPLDWRVTSAAKSDIGVRPLLDSLGPVIWSPTPAPTWQAITSEGSTIGISNYRGRPVALIFFLGAGCLHCVEQLEKFAPVAKEFDNAGIQLVAISTDSCAAVQQQLAKAAKSKPIPFRVASDEHLRAFRKFRAFDDFENRPLHATILIDGNGAIRWQDIGFEPFADAKFLLEESKRLLGLRKHQTIASLHDGGDSAPLSGR